MKELSIEEKAKAYDSIIEKANKMHYENCEACQICIEELIPELKESEDDRIRKAIIERIQNWGSNSFGNITKEEALAWLEKQGEQPKKHDVCDTCDQQGSCVSPCPMKLVEKQGEQKPAEWIQELEYKLANATPEQLAEWKEKYFKVESAWSEDDEKIYQSIMDDTVQENQLNSNQTNWLRDIKYRYFPQPKQEWSGSDEAHLHSLITHLEQWIESNPDTTGADIQGENVAWLKSLRPQNKWKPSDEQMIELRRVISGCSYDIEPPHRLPKED